MSYWTIEEVAEFLDITVGQVRESRRRKEYPGNLGRLRGRRLLFPQDLVEAGPQEQETTSDPVVALLWTAQGIEAKLGEILTLMRSQGMPFMPWNPSVMVEKSDDEPAYPPGYDADDLKREGTE